MLKPLLLIVLFIIAGCSHNANQQFTEQEIIEIYYTTQYTKIEVSEQTLKKYNMEIPSRRRDYFNKVKEMTDTPEKYDDFLKKIEEFKQNYLMQEQLNTIKEQKNIDINSEENTNRQTN